MAYTPIGWLNDQAPAINQTNLKKMDNELVYLDSKTADLQEALSLDSVMIEGSGNTFVGPCQYGIVQAGSKYRVHIIDWSKEGLTQSGSAYWLRVGYTNNGMVTYLYSQTTNGTLPSYLDIKIPADVANPELVIGGRVTSGKRGILQIECLDESITLDNVNSVVEYYSFDGIGNTFVSKDTGVSLIPGHSYRVNIGKWPHNNIPSSSSSALFQIYYVKSGSTQNIQIWVTSSTLPKYYDFVFPASEDETNLYIGGRIDSGACGVVTVEDFTRDVNCDKNTAIRENSNWSILNGVGNTYISTDTNIKLDVGSTYRVFVKKWNHANIPSSATAILLEAGYVQSGTKYSLKIYVTNSTLPDYFDMKIPSTATAPVYFFIGGRIDSGEYGIVNVENVDEVKTVTDINNAVQNIFMPSAGNNVFAEGDRLLNVNSGHFYRIVLVDWDRTTVPTTGAGSLFAVYYVVNDTSTRIWNIVQTETLAKEYTVYIPDGLTNPKLRIGGRVSSGHVGIVSIEDLTEMLPEYVQTLVDKLNGELEKHQSSNSCSFGFITDIHVSGTDMNTSVLWAMLMSKKALNEINKKNPIEMVVFNGDYLNNGSSTTKSTVLGWYKYFNKVLEGLDMIQFRGKGNHDNNDIGSDSSQYLTNEEFYQAFAKKTSMKWFKMDYGNIVRDYGYYDDVNRKIRFIFIDTVDLPDGYEVQHIKGISNEQLNFVANALYFSEPDWAVVFLSHHALQDNEVMNPSHSEDHYLTPEHGGTPLMGVINAFINKTEYSYTSSVTDWEYDVDVDYTNNASGEVIAMFSGHTHADAMTTVDGYVMLATTSAGISVGGYDSEGNQISKKQYTVTETSWDIITIDRKNKKVYADRYGGETSREISYGGV